MKKLFRKRILITGATGLIGSFMTDLLLYADRTRDAGIEVYILVRDAGKGKRRFASSIEERKLHFIIQDVTEPLRLTEPVDYIIHAAGDGFPAAFRKRPVETMTPAVLGTYQLLQYAKNNMVKRFLYVSSGEVYGNRRGSRKAFTENDAGYLDSLNVRSCYSSAKRCGETMCMAFGEEYGIPAAVARPGHIYGACTSADDNRATVQFLKCAAAKRTITLHSEGQQMRSYTYVADCVSGLLTVLLNGGNGEAYNIANAASRVTIAEFAGILARQAGVDCAVKSPDEAEKKEHTPIEYAVLDSSKLEGLGWQGQYDIRTGIEHMFAIRRLV